jgi:DNA-directed RNA polymerase specialized sigma24 family protein
MHEFVPSRRQVSGEAGNRNMEVGLIDCTTNQFLGHLRQFGFILTGDETTADAAVADALLSARRHIDEADGFPCHRSWLFANLLRVLNDRNKSSAALQPAHSCWISLLEVPHDERALLVLVDGYKFDIATAALIMGASAESVQQTLNQARLAFHNLTRGASCDRNEK